MSKKWIEDGDKSIFLERTKEFHDSLICTVYTIQGEFHNDDSCVAGTGFCVHSKGLIMTCAHVVSGPIVKISVCDMVSGKEYKASIVKVNANWDVALLQFKPKKPVDYVKLAGHGYEVYCGEQVHCIGNPATLTGSFCSGRVLYPCSLDFFDTDQAVKDLRDHIRSYRCVSSLDEDADTSDTSNIPLIQTDIRLVGGASGAPLFDNRGCVVGMLSVGLGPFSLFVHYSVLSRFLQSFKFNEKKQFKKGDDRKKKSKRKRARDDDGSKSRKKKHEDVAQDATAIGKRGKLCDTCGAVGYKELTRTCSQCTIRRHIYCMPVFDRDMPEDWVCELCLPKNDTDSLKPDLKEDVLDSSREISCDLGRQVECKMQKAVETGKVKFLPTEEVIKLSSGTPRKEISLKSYFGSKHSPEKATASLSKRLFSGSRTVDPYFKPIKVRKNPSFLQLESVRRGGVQISSSIRQHAVKTLRESKESAHVVPNKENVCKGQVLDAILPDKDLSTLQSKNKESMRLSLTSPTRLRTNIVGSGQNFHQAAEDDKSDVAERKTWDRLKISLYRRHLPAVYTTWTGGFKFLDTAIPGEFYGGFLARPSCRVHRKAYELSQKMPPVLRVNLLQQCHLQADLFQNGCLDLRDIALYFFPVDYMERSQENYNQLFQLMVIKNSVMTSYIDGMELLIFTSRQLHADSQDVFTRSQTDFFCGMFRRAKDNQMEVHQKLSSFASHLEYAHDYSAYMGSGEEVDMDVDMVGGKIVGIPDAAFSKEPMQEFGKWAAKETLDVTRDRFLSVSGDLNLVIEPTLLESEKKCCNDSDLPPKSPEKMNSKSTPKPIQHPLEISLGSLPGNMGEIDIPPGFEVMSKLNSSDRAPKAPNAEEKIGLDEKQIMSRVKAEIGCQSTLQVASGVSSRPQPHRSAEDASLRGSQKQYQVSANDPLDACSPPPCLLGDGAKVGFMIKIERNDNKKPFQMREKKGQQGLPFLSQDKAQIAGSCSVEVKARVQELANDPSAVCPRLLEKDTKIGLQIKTQEYDEEKRKEKKGKKGSEAGSFGGPCAVVDKAKMQNVKHDKVNTSHRLHTTLPSNMETLLLSRPFASTRVRLSVAGRSSGNPGAASAGGLIRDESGRWIVGYNLNLGLCGFLATDLWALFQGIKFTWDRGYRKVLIESDSAAAVESLKKTPPLLNSNRALIERCYDLLHGEWDCKVRAIRRDENLCADWLATYVKGRPLGISIINSAPPELIPLLEADSIRVAHAPQSPSSECFSTFESH